VGVAGTVTAARGVASTAADGALLPAAERATTS
jgi:hypothetical protein